MKLEDLLEVIDSETEFVLYKGDRIGIFNKSDIGIKEYFNCEVWNIMVEDKKFVISLDH